MARCHLLLGFTAAFIMCFCPGRAVALDLVEVWRSPWGVVTSVSVDPDDGSCWAAVGDKVIHIASDGSVLSETPGFFWPSAVSVNRADNSCWVAEYGYAYYSHDWSPHDGLDRVAHVGEDGEVLWSGAGFNSPWDLSANPTDGSCWVADTGNDQVVRLGADGSELWLGGGFSRPLGVSVNSADGSCWVADTYNDQVLHLAADGTEIWRGSRMGPELVSVNSADGSCWVASSYAVYHLSAEGGLISMATVSPTSLSVNPADGSWWIADFGDRYFSDDEPWAEVRHYAADFTELWRGDEFARPEDVSANSTDGSCWVADPGADQIVHLDEHGSELLRVGNVSLPWCVSVNPADASGWVIEWGSRNSMDFSSELVHYRADGEEIWRGGNLGTPWWVSVDPSDGSCWVTDAGVYDSGSDQYVGGALVHLAADGTELDRIDEVAVPWYLSVDASDGSCWVSDFGVRELVHVAADGTVLWRGGDFSMIGRIAASPSDGSCWVVDCGRWQLVHIAADGTELWRSDGQGTLCRLAVSPEDGSCWATDNSSVRHYSAEGEKLSDSPLSCCPWALAVDPRDGSCWVAANSSFDLVRLSSEGVELSRQKIVHFAESIAVNPVDGSLWIADVGAGQLAHLAWPALLFTDIASDFWACGEIAACAGAGIVSGYEDGTYGPSGEVDRAQMAVYIARAMAGGEENIPEGGRPRSFVDVPREHWAFDHIEYLKAAGVVTGYALRVYAPDLPVTRDQMAVYIARSTGWVTNGDDMTGTSELFPDVPAGHWAGTAIQECLDRGIVQGYEDGCYHPEIVVTRDQMAVYVAMAFDL
jgi:DNA-binding beta-propeller fold protein YncE